MFQLFNCALLFFLFFENVFSLQISEKFFLSKKKSFEKANLKFYKDFFSHVKPINLSEKTLGLGNDDSKNSLETEKKIDFLKKVEETFKNILLLNDNKKFDAVLTEMLELLSPLDVAKVFYNIFSTVPILSEELRTKLKWENPVLMEIMSLSIEVSRNLGMFLVKKKNEGIKNIYVLKFNHFLEKNKRWNEFKKDFLKKVSDLNIFVFLLEHTCLSYPEEKVECSEESLDNSFFSSSLFNVQFVFPILSVKKSKHLIHFESKEFLSPENEVELDLSLAWGLQCPLKTNDFLTIKESDIENIENSVFPSFFKLSFPVKKDQWKNFDNWMNVEETDPDEIATIVKNLVKQFPLVESFAKLSQKYSLSIESLWIGKNDNANGSFYIIFKTTVPKYHQNISKQFEQNLKKTLLLKDSKEFENIMRDGLRTLSASKIAEVLYAIFSTVPVMSEELLTNLEEKESFLIGVMSRSTKIVLKRDGSSVTEKAETIKNIYLLKFNHFLEKNERWNDFKKDFLRKVSNCDILLFLLKNTCLSYATEKKELLKESPIHSFFTAFFTDYFLNTQIFNMEVLFPMVFESNECLKNPFTKKSLFPSFFKLSFSVKKEDEWINLKKWMHIEITDPSLITTIIQTLIDQFPLMSSFIKISQNHNFTIRSLWMEKNCGSNLFYIILKVKDHLKSNPSLEFLREQQEIKMRMTDFFNKKPYNQFAALMSEFLLGKFPNIQANDFVLTMILFFKEHFLQFKDDKIKKSEWKKLIKKEDFGRIKEKMELIYQKLPCDSEEDWKLKENFFYMMSSLDDLFSKKLCVDA